MPDSAYPGDSSSVTGRPLSTTDLARIFKALADPVRVRILFLVGHSTTEECGFADLARIIEIPQSSLSHHLHVMVNAGVLLRERRGTASWYSLNPESAQALMEFSKPGGFQIGRPR